jgi:TonB family protein
VLSLAKANYTSNKQGTVRVKVCVNSAGQVISAEATQSGSTTTDASLRTAAANAARQCKFAPEPGADEQCGWIEYNFILK